MFTIEIFNVKSHIVEPLPSYVCSRLRDKLSYEIPGAYFAKQKNPYAGQRYFFTKVGQSFPTGLIHYVEDILQNEGLSYTIIDRRSAPKLGSSLSLHDITLRDYQQEAVEVALKRQRGIIQAATGSGKTSIIAALVARTNLPTLILIHKTDVFYQIIKSLEETLRIPIGRIGNGLFDIQQVSVGMIQTVAKALDNTAIKANDLDLKIVSDHAQVIKQLVTKVDVLITDECHHVAADSFWSVYSAAGNAFFRWGMSASPWRTDNADLLIEAAHAKQIIKISASSLITRGYLTPPELYLLKVKHDPIPKGIRYPQVYADNVVNNIERNILITQLALAAAKQNKAVLIAVTKIEHGQLLELVLQKYDPSAIFVSGESDMELRQQVLKDLDEHKRKIVICTTIFGEGINCPGIDVLINAKAAASSVDAFQLVGRALRLSPNKKIAYVIDLFDEGCRYLGAHSSARLKIYKTEPKYLIKVVSTVEDVRFDR